jgi:hypothetical protein
MGMGMAGHKMDKKMKKKMKKAKGHKSHKHGGKVSFCQWVQRFILMMAFLSLSCSMYGCVGNDSLLLCKECIHVTFWPFNTSMNHYFLSKKPSPFSKLLSTKTSLGVVKI